jgi:Fe-S-cluster containining protein
MLCIYGPRPSICGSYVWIIHNYSESEVGLVLVASHTCHLKTIRGTNYIDYIQSIDVKLVFRLAQINHLKL